MCGLQNGGGESYKDSACRLESQIASSRGVDRPQVLSSLRDSQSPNSSTTILESKSENKKLATTSHATLESKNLDSRDCAISLSLRGGGKAIHKQSLDFSAKVDCRADKSARNDRKNSPCEKLDSSTNALSPSLRAVCQHGVAIHNSAPAKSISHQSHTHKARNLASASSSHFGAWGAVSLLARFLCFAGINAIYFYIAQGISASLLFPILRHFPPLVWWVKLPLAFCINLALCVVFVWILIVVFATLRKLAVLGIAKWSKPEA